MRLSTIWTIQSMSTMERLRRTQEWAIIEIARRLPRKIKYWTVISAAVNASDSYPAETKVIDVLKNLEK